MGGVEKVHFIKLPPPLRPYFLIAAMLECWFAVNTWGRKGTLYQVAAPFETLFSYRCYVRMLVCSEYITLCICHCT